MARPFVILTAFGSAPGDNWFRTAFNWDRDKIFQWLDDVSKGKKGGPRAQDPDVQNLLKDAYAKIRALSCPDGRVFIDPNAQPNSHFPRITDNDWTPERRKDASKFSLVEWPGIYRRGPKEAEITVPYWSPYDLLGYFLSLLGPAPDAANKSNYFLPLTAVYARWCAKIAGRPPAEYGYPNTGNGEGTWPYMFQCTWRKNRGRKPQKWFFLGASIAGDGWRPFQVGTWKDTVQKHRFNLLWASSQMKLVSKSEFEWPPEKKAAGSGNPFGNCAETYPFVEKMFSDKDKNRRLFGLALQRDFMERPDLDTYDEFVDGVIWKNLTAPCMNCATLIDRSGALAARFAIDFDINRAPQRPGIQAGQAKESEEVQRKIKS